MPSLSRYVLLSTNAALVLILAVPGGTFAQRTSRFDPVVEVIPYRELAEISREIDNATVAKDLSGDNQYEAEQRLIMLDAAIKTKKAQMEEIQARRDLAKNQKQRTEIVALEAELRARKSAVDMLGKLKELRKSELETARLRAKQSDYAMQALQLEIELNRRRAERDSLAMSGASEVTVSTATQVIYDLETKLLKAQKALADVSRDVAGKDREVVDRRIRLYQAHAKLASPNS